MFVTGFSGGRYLAWLMIFLHPEELRGATLAAGGYIGRGITRISDSGARINLPVKGFQGSDDDAKEEIDICWQRAMKDANEHGYRNISRVIVPGAKHSPFAEQSL